MFQEGAEVLVKGKVKAAADGKVFVETAADGVYDESEVNMPNELTAVIERTSVPSTVMPAMDIHAALERYGAIKTFVSGVMVDGLDYGEIPGTDRKTLLKPGAEKLATIFALTPKFEMLDSMQDWRGEQTSGEPFFSFTYRCRLYRGDWLVAECEANANSWEDRYRWRWVREDQIPKGQHPEDLVARVSTAFEYTFAINRAETTGKYGKPAAYWQRFADAIASGKAVAETRQSSTGKTLEGYRIDSVSYRVPNENIFTQVNTLMKIAQKRAFVGAVLIGVNASNYFTQDVEDYYTGDDGYDDFGANTVDAKPAETKDATGLRDDDPDWHRNPQLCKAWAAQAAGMFGLSQGECLAAIGALSKFKSQADAFTALSKKLGKEPATEDIKI